MRVIKLSKNGDNSFFILDRKNLDQAFMEVDLLIDDGEIGDFITITLAEMDEQEFKDLPEWDGW